jgi:hypothetical protein
LIFLGPQGDLNAVRFMCHPNVSLQKPLSFLPSPTRSLLELSIIRACEGWFQQKEESGSESISLAANVSHCTCQYHVTHPLSDSSSCIYPCLSDLLQSITVEDCERIAQKKRERELSEMDGTGGEDEDWKSQKVLAGQNSEEHEGDDNIATIMGFGSFGSPKSHL